MTAPKMLNYIAVGETLHPGLLKLGESCYVKSSGLKKRHKRASA